MARLWPEALAGIRTSGPRLLASSASAAYIGPLELNRIAPPLLDTPCVNICVLDPDTGHCVGCGRSVEEIARWSGMTPGERRAIMTVLPERMARLENAKG